MAEKAVTIYSTPTCPWCRKAKEFLVSKGIQFTDFNVSEDHARLDEMVSLTGQRGVPVIKVNGEIIVGFNQDKIEKALGG